MLQLAELAATGFQTWKLDGIYTRGAAFVAIAVVCPSQEPCGKWEVASRASNCAQ